MTFQCTHIAPSPLTTIDLANAPTFSQHNIPSQLSLLESMITWLAPLCIPWQQEGVDHNQTTNWPLSRYNLKNTILDEMHTISFHVTRWYTIDAWYLHKTCWCDFLSLSLYLSVSLSLSHTHTHSLSLCMCVYHLQSKLQNVLWETWRPTNYDIIKRQRAATYLHFNNHHCASSIHWNTTISRLSENHLTMQQRRRHAGRW